MNLRFWARWRWVRLTRDGWWFATVVACTATVAGLGTSEGAE